MLEESINLYRCKHCKTYFCTNKDKRITSPCCKHKAKHKLIGKGYKVSKDKFDVEGIIYTIYYEVDDRHYWEINPRSRIHTKKRKSRNNQKVEDKNES